MRVEPTSKSTTAFTVARAAGGLAILVGGGHVMAWVSGLMTELPASMIVMKTNAGLGLLVSGLALLLLAAPDPSAGSRRVARACAGFALLLGLATFSEHVFGWNLGIDQLLATEPLGAVATVSPNRMGPPASLSFCLLGIALLLLTGRTSASRHRSLHEPLALLVALLGLLSIIGYLYSASELYHVARITGIAWPTALSFVVLAVGVFCLRPTSGLMRHLTADDPGGAIIRALLGPMVLLPIVLGWVRLAGERHRWYDAAMGTALMMLVFIVTFSSLLLFAGRRVSASSAARRRIDAERQRAADQAREERDRLVTLINSIRDEVWFVDASRRLTLANPAVMHEFLLPNGTLDAEKVASAYEVLRPDGTPRPLDEAPPFRALRGEILDGVEEIVRTPATGELRHRIVSAGPVRDASGNIIGAVAVVRDITERKNAEDALREADRRKNEFLAMLSHELRNPLAPVRAALHVLEHAAPGGERANQARTVIDRQVAQLTRLVDDLLDLTRITRGKIQIHSEALELTGLARRTAEDHRSLFAAKGVELDVDIPDREMWVNGDALRLAQAIGNLLHNAAKFTDRGGRTTLRIGKPEDSEAAVISVRDTGIGISAHALPHLFEPFMQVDETLDRARGGLGLGLALVKSLVEMHDGTVAARSDGVGSGAEFTIRLPLGAPPPSRERAPGDRHYHPRRVFIIEDNVDAAESLREALEIAGHDVEVAYDGVDGIEMARAFRPEIILCDIGLPGMSGYDVARALRNDQAFASAYLVALTGYALPEDLARARQAGFDLHVPKPASPEKLQKALATLGRTPRTRP